MEGGDIIAISSKRSKYFHGFLLSPCKFLRIPLAIEAHLSIFERGLALLVAPQGESISKGGSAASVDVHKKSLV